MCCSFSYWDEMRFRCWRLLAVLSVKMVQSRLWQKPIWISYESSSSWCLNMKAFTSPLSHDRCPREIGSLSCKVQRDTTAAGNHETHHTQTPSCLVNKRTVCSAQHNNRLTIFSELGRKISVGGGGGYLYFFPRRIDDETDLSAGSSSAVAVVKP